MDFQEITVGSDAYRQECELRQDVLRRPLGLNLYDEDLSEELDHRHFGIFESDKLVACIVAIPEHENQAKLRQMAVAPNTQGCGYGRKLVNLVEDVLAKEGCLSLSLHARESAIGFYAKLGYQIVGDVFNSVGIPHRLMVKKLEPPTGSS
ncbi:GNAT family N-acetyltransferase [Pelagicoccus albus]|uniref:GNAT family N-acetyltransferase n=1 Tax=Pelagicoccus albus TaxID=415222 RepID=A0A7X1B364_9BACT|nr:GNAT family N-acetyltransferase [Pelagicoccus albus]MBC2604799.1 GNAT family N-acetyltransferase [Pelagicoccus albus]